MNVTSSAQAARKRHKIDFFTNPAFSEMLQVLFEIEQREVAAMRGAGQGGDVSKVNYHTGIAEGVLRARKRMESEAQSVLNPDEEDEDSFETLMLDVE